MKYAALSLFVIGVANAGTVVTHSSGSGAVNNNQFGAINTPILGSGQAAQLAAGAGWSGNQAHSSNWQAQCDEDSLHECAHDIHVGPAGEGASGNAISNTYIVAAGEQVIPAQIIHSDYVLNATNTSTASSNNTVAAHQEENWNVTGRFTNQRYEVYQSCHQADDNFTVNGARSSDYSAMDADWNFDECDCKPVYGRRAGEIADDLSAEACGEKKQSLANPYEDLNRRINSQVEKTISDILSEAINRCISTSLHGCIDLQH